MKALLAFTSIQIMVYIFSMSNAITISLIVLGSAVIIFTGVYISALIKDKRHQRKSVYAALELQ